MLATREISSRNRLELIAEAVHERRGDESGLWLRANPHSLMHVVARYPPRRAEY